MGAGEASGGGPLGVIFRGGRGRRLGGVDKGAVPLAGETLFTAVLSRLAPQCDEVVVSARAPGAAGGGLRIVPDVASDEGGPVVALLSVLRWAAAARPGWRVLTTPVDTPFLPTDLHARLGEAIRAEGARSGAAQSGGRLHGLSALYEPDVLPALEDLVARGERGVRAVHDALGSAVVLFEDEPVDPFLNVNHPGDLDRARRAAERLTIQERR